jgi:hypothetical protein
MRDADIQQASFEAAGRNLDRLKDKGICAHGSLRGKGDGSEAVICRNCGEEFASFEEAVEAFAEFL